MTCAFSVYIFFFFNDTATTEIYTLSLHDALPISFMSRSPRRQWRQAPPNRAENPRPSTPPPPRSEEHTSELQSQFHLVCRLLLEKKKKQTHTNAQCRHTQYTKSKTLSLLICPLNY